MHELRARAWTADWLVGWLAAVGVTYRCPTVHLHWSAGPVPHAIFTGPSIHSAVEDALPSPDEVQMLAIARSFDSLDEFERNPTLDVYRERASLARTSGDLSLGATISDIGHDPKKNLPHSPLDAAVPRGVTLHDRLVKSIDEIGDTTVGDSMAGRAPTASSNGLGFDLRRLAPACVPGDNLVVEPVAETLAFFGLLLFIQRGDRTRGWAGNTSQFAAGAFRWPTWVEPLDWPAIDSLYDLFEHDADRGLVTAAFESIAYSPTGSADTTRGYAGRPARR